MKIRRFSNIHSWMRIEPAHWVASATAIDVRSAGNAGHGPSWTLDLYSPRSRETTSVWSPGTMTSAPSSSECRPRRLNTRRIIRRSSGMQSLIRTSPPVTPASAMNEPISMWSGLMSCTQPPSLSTPWTVSTFEPMPSIRAPILVSIRARSWTCGSQATLPMTVVPGVSAAASSAFSVAMTEGSSMNTSPARRPPGAVSVIVPLSSCSAPERAEGVEVRVQAPAADDVAAGRRHDRAAGAGQQRAGEQERRADLLGQVDVDLAALAVDAGRRTATTSFWPRHSTRDAEVGEDVEHGLDVPNSRDVAQDDLFVGQDRGGEDRERAVLVAGGDDGAAERHAALDDEFLHERGRG